MFLRLSGGFVDLLMIDSLHTVSTLLDEVTSLIQAQIRSIYREPWSRPSDSEEVHNLHVRGPIEVI